MEERAKLDIVPVEERDKAFLPPNIVVNELPIPVEERVKVFLPAKMFFKELLIELRPLQLRFRLISGERPPPVTGA